VVGNELGLPRPGIVADWADARYVRVDALELGDHVLGDQDVVDQLRALVVDPREAAALGDLVGKVAEAHVVELVEVVP
jgi:hypothetical protein